MSTQAYYKERLGFDPQEAMQESLNGGAYYDGPHQPKRHRGEHHDKHDQVYEENLTKFKDERDAIQKKTFTKWVNKHLKKVNRHVNDLFEDLRDGLNLISLLEVLSGEHLPRERGRMRFHMLQNVQMALDFLRYKKIKLVNIRAEDIVDGNPKLTLGLIWTIILHFQVSALVFSFMPVLAALILTFNISLYLRNAYKNWKLCVRSSIYALLFFLSFTAVNMFGYMDVQ